MTKIIHRILGERKLSWLQRKHFEKGVHRGTKVAPVDTNRTNVDLGFLPTFASKLSYVGCFQCNGKRILIHAYGM